MHAADKHNHSSPESGVGRPVHDNGRECADSRRLSADYLVGVTTAIFQACGAPKAEAQIVAEHLVEANLMGMDSHGVIRIPQYVGDAKRGVIVPSAEVKVVHDAPAAAIVDAGWNFGQVGAVRAAEVAMEKAGRLGLGCATLRRVRHVGCLSIYSIMAAERNFVSIATCGSAGEGHRVCPWGGREGRLATNPIAFAAPSNGDPIVLDFATSAASEGKVRLMLNRGEQLPDGWIIDGNGRASSNPADLYGPPKGAILPVGGDQGYKGFALGVMAQILSGMLGQPAWREEALEANANVMWFLAMDVGTFMPTGEFRSEVSDFIDYMKSSAPMSPSGEIIMPGELNFREKKSRAAAGVPVDDETWRQIAQTADELGVQL